MERTYDNKCLITGDRNYGRNLHATHFFPYSGTDDEIERNFPDLTPADKDSSANVALLQSGFNGAIEANLIGFAATQHEGAYTVVVPTAVECPSLSRCRGNTVNLAVDPSILSWHLSNVRTAYPSPGAK